MPAPPWAVGQLVCLELTGPTARSVPSTALR